MNEHPPGIQADGYVTKPFSLEKLFDAVSGYAT